MGLPSSRTPSFDAPAMEGTVRKRVCKACDRCRLKKSKCDGLSPCNRCRMDNAICVFGERKKSHDKVYPKGYVEMLEQQQDQLISGIRMLYTRCLNNEGWIGASLDENSDGHPLTHDILQRLDLLHMNDAGDSEEVFEESCEKLQKRMRGNGAPNINRHGSEVHSDSEHSGHHSHQDSPLTSTTAFRDPFNARNPPSTPPMHNNFPQLSRPVVKMEASPPVSLTPPPFLRPELSAHPFLRNGWQQENPLLSETTMWNDFPSPLYPTHGHEFGYGQQYAFNNAQPLSNNINQYPVDWPMENDENQAYLHTGINA